MSICRFEGKQYHFCILCVCRTDPPTPPSASAEKSKMVPFIKGVQECMKNKDFWLLNMLFSVTVAICMALVVNLEAALCPNGYTPYFSASISSLSMIGIGTIFSGYIAGLVDETKEFEKYGKILLAVTIVFFFALQFFMFSADNEFFIVICMIISGMTALSIYPIAPGLTGS